MRELRLQMEMSAHDEQGNREGFSQEKILAARIFSCEMLSTALEVKLAKSARKVEINHPDPGETAPYLIHFF